MSPTFWLVPDPAPVFRGEEPVLGGEKPREIEAVLTEQEAAYLAGLSEESAWEGSEAEDFEPSAAELSPELGREQAEGLSGVEYEEVDYEEDAELQEAESGGRTITGEKHLANGKMSWTLFTLGEHEPPDLRGRPFFQDSFLPRRLSGTNTITFLQTVRTSRAGNFTVDVQDQKWVDYVPFYGVIWDPQQQKWTRQDEENYPAGAGNPRAVMTDIPQIFTGQIKMFETVPVVAETGEMLGALRWGADSDGRWFGAENRDCTDAPSVAFRRAVETFYATPTPLTDTGGSHRAERYDAILDGFTANDGVSAPGPHGVVFSAMQKAAILTAEHQKKLDSVVAVYKEYAKRNLQVKLYLGGFADSTEVDPPGTSEQRARVTKRYLVGQGIPAGDVSISAFGSGWARYPPSMQESRNRRVQILSRLATSKVTGTTWTPPQ